MILSLSKELLLNLGSSVCDYTSIDNDVLRMSQAGYPTSKENDVSERIAPSKELAELEDIISSFVQSPKRLWQQYGHDLWKSLDALEKIGDKDIPQIRPPDLNEVSQRIQTARKVVKNRLLCIFHVLSSEDDRFR